MSLDSTTIKWIAIGSVVGYLLASNMTSAEDTFVASDDFVSSFDDTPPATAPLSSAVEDLGPVMTLGARPLGGRSLGGSILGSLRPRRVYHDPTSNNPGAYRPASSVSLRPPAPPAAPKPAAPAAKPALKPASTAAGPSVKGTKIARAPTPKLKSPFSPEIDSRDGMIVQPFR